MSFSRKAKSCLHFGVKESGSKCEMMMEDFSAVKHTFKYKYLNNKKI